MGKKTKRRLEREERENLPGPNAKEAREAARRLRQNHDPDAGEIMNQRRKRVEEHGRGFCDHCGNKGADCICEVPFYADR
jgi:hypothetical protein